MKLIVLMARIAAIFIMALFILRFMASAQAPLPAPPDLQIESAVKTSVIDQLLKNLNEDYVFPDVAKKMENSVRLKQKSKEYDGITSGTAFAKKLTEDLQAISHDKHLRVFFNANVIPERKPQAEPTAAERAEALQKLKRNNFGFARVERLDGNIGLIDLRGFSDEVNGADTVAAAMTFLSGTDALIFDLRQNGGGNPAMIALISSYLFGDKPVHLNDLYFRKGEVLQEFWTKPENAKRKFTDKDVFVVTSGYTFSGGEEFTNNLKVLKRATIVGETTGGGANPGGSVRLNEHFSAFIPVGRAVNPITKTNWEGTGVEPDVKVAKEIALKTAYSMALTKLAEKEKNAYARAALQFLIDKTQKEIAEMKPIAKALP